MKLSKRLSGIRIETYVAIFMFLMGVIMMNLVPTWQTPDELTHLGMIGSEIGKEDAFSYILYEDAEFGMNRIMGNPDEKVDRAELAEAMTGTPQYNREEMMPESMGISIVRHLPATLGILLGILLGLPTYWVLLLGELCALLFYVLICHTALKIMPIKKELFAIVMLMPMALQQAGSLNYDAVVLPLCFLLIAYIFKLKFQDEITLMDFVKLLGIWLVITYIKMPYCLIIFLVFILPIEKIHVRVGKLEINELFIRKVRVPVCIFGMIIAGVAVYLLRDVFYVEMILSLITEWKRSLYLFFQTGVTHTGSLIVSTVGNFGWLDTPIRGDFALMVFVMITAFALVNNDNKTEVQLRTWDRIVIWGTAIALCVFTATAMINHTIMMILYGSEWADKTYDIRSALYQIPYIGGIQGRYYLPFVSLLFIPLPQVKRINKKIVWSAVALFEIVMFIYIIHKLLGRYWIA